MRYEESYLIQYWSVCAPGLHGALTHVLSRLHLPVDWADELLQEVAIVFFTHQEGDLSFPERYPESVWRPCLYRTAFNLAFDLGRARKNQSSANESLDSAEPEYWMVPSQTHTTEAAMLVERGLKELDLLERNVVMARMAVMSHAEIAATFGISIAWSQKLYQRAIIKMRLALLKQKNPAPDKAFWSESSK